MSTAKHPAFGVGLVEATLPATFVSDHFDRDLPQAEGGHGEIRRWSGRNVVVRLNAKALANLESDARFYAHRDGPDECPLPIKRSATATVGALGRLDITSALKLPEIDYTLRTADGCTSTTTYRVLPDSYVREIADSGWSPEEPDAETASATLIVRWPDAEPRVHEMSGDAHRDIEEHGLFDEIAREIACGREPQEAVQAVLTQHCMEMAENVGAHP